MKTLFVVVGVVQFQDKFLLLQKHKEDYNYPGKWSFCAGHAREFEAAEVGILREIKEETGLTAEIVKTGPVIEALDQENQKNWIVKPFLCSVQSDKVKLCHENDGFEWITLDQLPNFDTVPGIQQDLISLGLK